MPNNKEMKTLTFPNGQTYEIVDEIARQLISDLSNTITITSITGGHRISITNASGTQTFDVMDGTNGTTPIKGTDFWTAADKADMVDDVLDALPTWTGGAF